VASLQNNSETMMGLLHAAYGCVHYATPQDNLFDFYLPQAPVLYLRHSLQLNFHKSISGPSIISYLSALPSPTQSSSLPFLGLKHKMVSSTPHMVNSYPT
jgi:hypothetical protein